MVLLLRFVFLHQAKDTAQNVASKVTTEVKKRGVVDNVKARTGSLWAQIKEVRASS